MFEPSRRPRTGGPSLHLEALEDRAVPAVIGGVVYEDLNRNGLLGAGEAGIGGSQLQLFDSTGKVIATTTSDAQGRYQFTKRDASTLAPTQMTVESEFGPARTNASRTTDVNQFDPKLGTLTSIEIVVEGGVQAHVQLENLEKTQATLRTDLDATIQFQAPGAGMIEAKPVAKLEAMLEAFDGQLDLRGASAKTVDATRLDGQFTTLSITNPADLAAYVGSGKVMLTQNASVTSTTSGPGNLMAMIQSTTSGKVKVVYHYTPSDDLGPGKYTILQTQPASFVDWFETKDNVTPLPSSNASDLIEVTITSPTEQQMSNHFGEGRPQAVATAVVTPQPVARPGDVMLYVSKSFWDTETLLKLGW